MTRYLVERTFADGLAIPTDDEGATTCRSVVDGNAQHGVTWVQSHVNRSAENDEIRRDDEHTTARLTRARLVPCPETGA